MKQLWERYNWLNAFYLLSAFIVFWDRPRVNAGILVFDSVEWRFPFNFFPIATAQPYEMGYYIFIGIFVLLALLPFAFTALFAPFLWASWLAMVTSFGSIHNSEHGYFLAALGVAVAYLFKRKQQSFDFAIAASTSMYTCAGLWKLRALLSAHDISYEVTHVLPHHIAFGIAENFREGAFTYLKFFANHEWLSGVSWVLIIAMQILIPLAIIFLKGICKIPFLLLLICFHISAKFLIGPDFFAEICLLWLFVAILIYRRIERVQI